MNNFKRVLAVFLAGTMVAGSSVAAFAADTSKTANGAGTYEGDKMAYPTLSVTLPTAPDDYNYIADPNGNIAATNGARIEGATFSGNTGIYFLTDKEKKQYSEVSPTLTVSNENAQDIIVSAELKIRAVGKNTILLSKTADFSGEDVKDKTAIYLAIQNGAKTKVAPLESGDADTTASIEMLVKGKKDNYKATYNTTSTKYEYALKGEASTLTWNKCAFNVTGAINKNVTWSLESTDLFPAITVTYKYAAVPVMTGDAANGYSYTWAANEPTGSILAITIDGIDRMGAVKNTKIKYTESSKKFEIDPAPVANFGLGTGNHTIVVKIGTAATSDTAESATEYTLNIEN